ncbi:hypothetical protein D3C87_1932580 [compost metagenome]
METGVACRPALSNFSHDNALQAIDAGIGRAQRNNLFALNAEITPNDATVADQFVHNLGGQLDGNGETQAFRRFTVGDFVVGQGIDTD